MQLMHNSEFDIFKMASKMVVDKFYKWEPHLSCRYVWWICNIPAFLPDGEALYKHVYLNKRTQHACLIELHCTSRHIWEWHQINKHVWCKSTSVRLAPDLYPFPFGLHSTSQMSVEVQSGPAGLAYSEVPRQQAWHIVRHHTRRYDLQWGTTPEGMSYSVATHQQTLLIVMYQAKRHDL